MTRPKQIDLFGKAHAIKPWVKCAWCGKSFQVARVRARNYCSGSHRTLAWRARRNARIDSL